MAAGLPVLATAVGGIGDLVAPGSTGELVPPRNAPAAGRVLAAWAADPSQLAVLGEAAHARARESFSREQMVGRYDALFTSLLDGAPPRGPGPALRPGPTCAASRTVG